MNLKFLQAGDAVIALHHVLSFKLVGSDDDPAVEIFMLGGHRIALGDENAADFLAAMEQYGCVMRRPTPLADRRAPNGAAERTPAPATL